MVHIFHGRGILPYSSSDSIAQLVLKRERTTFLITHLPFSFFPLTKDVSTTNDVVSVRHNNNNNNNNKNVISGFKWAEKHCFETCNAFSAIDYCIILSSFKKMCSKYELAITLPSRDASIRHAFVCPSVRPTDRPTVRAGQGRRNPKFLFWRLQSASLL